MSSFFHDLCIRVWIVWHHKNYKNEDTETKNSCHDWLINYIPEIIKKAVGDVKDKIIVLYKTNTNEKNYCVSTMCMVVERNQENQQ